MEAMTSRRALCGLLLASAVLACFGGWLWIASRPQVTRARFEQVKEGMSWEEVIRTVGGPPGDYSGGRARSVRDYIGWSSALNMEPTGEVYSWLCDDAQLLVRFDDNTAVTVRIYAPPAGYNWPPLTQRIRRWLGL
jgi:hypothetical protein